MTTNASQMTLEQRKQAVNRLQARLVQSLVLYGLLLAGAAAIVGSIYSPGVAEAPKRLAGSLAVFTVVGAGVFALIFLLPVIRWIGSRAEESRILPIWLLIGISFGFFTVFLTGASLPLVFAIHLNVINFTSLGTLANDLLDSVFRAPLRSFTFGVLALYVGFLVGPIYGIGAWLIDILNRMNYPHAYSDPWIESLGDMLPPTRRWASAAAPWLSVIGPWAIAIGIGGGILLFTATGPIEFLAAVRLGSR